jgi:phosphatidylserine decarboxylase
MGSKDNKEEYMMTIAKGGISWIASSLIFFVFFCICSVITTNGLQSVMFFLSFCSGVFFILLIIFFRDPDRTIGKDVIACADGIIREVKSISDPDIGTAWFISTFMNIYHVHVNRMPISGTITHIMHHSGSHLPAFKKESDRNERVVILVETVKGPVKIVLIAGTLARRIVTYIKKGDKVKKGDKISLIRLGSRVDIYLAKEMDLTVLVNKKDKVKAGGSTLAAPNA